MKFTFLGGADEVGASGLLVEIAGRRILVDCGIRPSPKARYGLSGDQLPDLSLLDKLSGIDAILVTHAHTDHTGALELVLGRYPDTPVYATPPTIAFTRVLHQDARRIMTTRLEEEGELPLFDDVAVDRLLAAFQPLPFHTRLPLSEGVAVTFYPAGHIAGAAMIGLESDEGRVLISGDLALSAQRTVSGAKLPAFEPDVFILESTYGGKLHANRSVQERRMIEVVNAVISAGGKVLIPAFALGRAQEVLLILSEFTRQGKLPPVPVWADGMVRAICQVYGSFLDNLPLPLQEQGADFFHGVTHQVQNNEQRNALIWQSEPAIVVASSGMLAGGPSLAYARALAGQPQHAILLTGYQDEEAPGRRLQEIAERGRGVLWLGKDKVDVQCRLGTYSLSSHADEGQLISMVETLNPVEVVLVHGDETARASLSQALKERKRSLHLPHAGQSLEFHFAPKGLASIRGVKGDRPLDVRALWQEAAGDAGGYFYINELAQVWWGTENSAVYGETDKANGPDQLGVLEKALASDDLYFTADTHRQDVYRAHTPAQVEIILQRRARMVELVNLPGQWVSLRGTANMRRLARCTATARDYFWVEVDDGETERAFPEDLLAVYGVKQPDPAGFQEQNNRVSKGIMEPNQVLALAKSQFPRAARLRKTGYRLDQRVLVLTFDFPDTAQQRFASQITSLELETSWKVEVFPEANQNSLFALAQEVLPVDWRIVKGPALFRHLNKVSITTGVPAAQDTAGAMELAARRFYEECGFELDIAIAVVKSVPVTAPAVLPDLLAEDSLTEVNLPTDPWEINAAYAAIKTALEGSTLYRTSLKGSEIVLSFISPQVGERYRAQIDRLSRQTGWKLSINPQPNQGLILEIAQALLEHWGLTLLKGPGVYPNKSEVTVTCAEPLKESQLAELIAIFEAQTGFRLLISSPTAAPVSPRSGEGRKTGIVEPKKNPAAVPATSPTPVVMIPVARVRLHRFQRELLLDPLKVEKAVERAQRLGQINPPIQVRRIEEGYQLIDGLYRLRAAEKLGFEHIQAIIE